MIRDAMLPMIVDLDQFELELRYFGLTRELAGRRYSLKNIT